MNWLRQISNRTILLFLAFVAFGSSALSISEEAEGYSQAWRSGWLQNFSTEIFGAIFTFLIFELFVGGRKEQTEKEYTRLKDQIQAVARLWQAENTSAKAAILDEMQILGLLKGAPLSRLDLSGINLKGYDLQNAELRYVKLVNSELGIYENATNSYPNPSPKSKSDIQVATGRIQGGEGTFIGMRLPDEGNKTISMRSSDERSMNIGMRLDKRDIKTSPSKPRVGNYPANISGADLTGADLTGAIVGGIKISKDTILPDGSNYEEPDDLIKFTHPSTDE